MSGRKVLRKLKRLLRHCSVSVRLEGCEIIKGKQWEQSRSFTSVVRSL
jgi:hypothetical protein